MSGAPIRDQRHHAIATPWWTLSARGSLLPPGTVGRPSLQLAHLSELRGELRRLHQALNKLHSSVEPVLMDASLASARSDLSAAEANMAPLSARDMNPMSVAPHTAATKHRGGDNDDLTDSLMIRAARRLHLQRAACARSSCRRLLRWALLRLLARACPSPQDHIFTVPGSTDGSSAANTPSEGPSPADNSAKQKKTATFTDAFAGTSPPPTFNRKLSPAPSRPACVPPLPTSARSGKKVNLGATAATVGAMTPLSPRESLSAAEAGLNTLRELLEKEAQQRREAEQKTAELQAELAAESAARRESELIVEMQNNAQLRQAELGADGEAA